MYESKLLEKNENKRKSLVVTVIAYYSDNLSSNPAFVWVETKESRNVTKKWSLIISNDLFCR